MTDLTIHRWMRWMSIMSSAKNQCWLKDINETLFNTIRILFLPTPVKIARFQCPHINAICGFTVWEYILQQQQIELKKEEDDFRSSKQILTSEKRWLFFSDVCAALRVYLDCWCLTLCLWCCILVEEWGMSLGACLFPWTHRWADEQNRVDTFT